MKPILLMLLSILMAGCSPTPEVQEEVVSVIVSPDKAHEVLISIQDPGALGARSTAVHLRRSGSKSGPRVFVAMHEPKIEVQWRDPENVEIAVSADADVRSETIAALGIRINRVPLIPSPDFVAEADKILRTKKEPNQPVQHNAGGRPFSSDSPASATPSAPAPRG